jgi:hypothetical protein
LNAWREKKGRQLTPSELRIAYAELDKFNSVCEKLLASKDRKSLMKSMDPNLLRRLEEFLRVAGTVHAKSRMDASSLRSGEETASAPGSAHEMNARGPATSHYVGDAEALPSDDEDTLHAWYKERHHRHRHPCRHFVSRATCPTPSCTWSQDRCLAASPGYTSRPTAAALAAVVLARNILHPQSAFGTSLTPPRYYPEIGRRQTREPFINEQLPFGYNIFHHGTRWWD